MYRRALRDWFTKTDFVTCDIQSRAGPPTVESRCPRACAISHSSAGGRHHQTSNAFWSYENTTMQPLHKVNKRYDALTREYLSSIYVDELDSPALSERVGPNYIVTNDKNMRNNTPINNPKNETSTLLHCSFSRSGFASAGKREPGCAEPHRTKPYETNRFR